LSVLALAAPIGTRLRLEVEGDDQDEAFKSVGALFSEGFGEI
jgi:phosphotransferase system HPr-like phosphotransfer protein